MADHDLELRGGGGGGGGEGDLLALLTFLPSVISFFKFKMGGEGIGGGRKRGDPGLLP